MWIKKPKKSDFRVLLSVGIVVVAMAIFSVFRLALYIIYHATFAAMSIGAVWSAFLNGLRFDLAMVALFIGPVILLFNLPVNSVRYMKACVMLMAAELIVMIGFLVGDLIYFPYVKRHITEEILQISADWGFVLGFMLTKTLIPLILLLLLFVGIGIWVHRFFENRYVFDPYYAKGELTKLFLCVVFIVLGIRGSLSGGKSLGIADVYKYASS